MDPKSESVGLGNIFATLSYFCHIVPKEGVLTDADHSSSSLIIWGYDQKNRMNFLRIILNGFIRPEYIAQNINYCYIGQV
jgi:hypothetical protein